MSTRSLIDLPKMLGDPQARADRRQQLREPHVAPLTEFVEALRGQLGPDVAIPDFDPWDGGIEAEVLYLLEAPGAKAVASGFISRDNPDETAKNFFLLNQEVGIPRTRTVTWNIVPWYIGTGTRIRAANRADILDASASLKTLLSLLPALRAVVLIGRKAEHAAGLIGTARPDVRLFITAHPSPLFINNAPENRDQILIVLRQVAEFIEPFAPSEYSDGSDGGLSTAIERLRKHSLFDEAQRAFAAYRAARDKLLQLGVIRSERSVAGDYGEWLAAEALGLTLAASGVQAGFDATDADGKTYQIKTRIVRDVDAATSFDIKETSQRFDYLIGVLLSPSCDLLGLLRVPAREVVSRAARNQGTRRLRWTRNCWDQSWVEVLYRRPIQVISP